MAIVKRTPEENAEREELKTQRSRFMSKEILDISVSVAREQGYYPAILLAYLTTLQAEYQFFGDTLNKREGKKWIPARSHAQIAVEQPLFPDGKTVKAAAQELETAGYILTESTGKFLEADHVTNRKRDVATWWHVLRVSLPDTLPVVTSEARQHGMTVAFILAYWRTQPEVEQGFRKLSAVEIEKALPMDERTARRHLKAMVAVGLLLPHGSKAKLYALGKPEVEPEQEETSEGALSEKLRAKYAEAAKRAKASEHQGEQK